jgi:GntR family transcriptional regulator / MocR family aminotransferase
MPSWELAVALDPAADQPIFLQIARAIAGDIRRGRLGKGAALPGSRALARSLKVHRNTVLAAYRELAAEGWIEAEAARGTRVSAALPDPLPRRFAREAAARAEVPSRVGFDLGPAIDRHDALAPPRGTLMLNGGVPDLRLLPVASLARAYRRALFASARASMQRSMEGATLDYGDPLGHPRLREALASMVSTVRGLAAGRETVMVTRGSQMALDLVARALISPGDVVAIESVGYRPAWEALRMAGGRLVPLPLDADGLRVDALSELAARERVRAVHVTPHHQYPTTAVLAPGRRLELLALARAHRIAIIEDDYDHEFHYEGRPVLPMASADQAGVVVYIGSLSKILAPGLRVGFVVAPEPLLGRLAAIRTFVDRQGDHTVERAVAELIEDGEVQRHARRVRRAYQERRDALVLALEKDLPGVLSFRVPPGGMALWARAAAGVDVDAWAERAAARGVVFAVGRRFAFDGRKKPFVRLGFATSNEEELREAVRRMAAVL